MNDTTPWISVDQIRPHPSNPNEHTPEQIQKIARSIDELDWGRPIILSSDNYILIGHGAYEAAVDILNLKKVPYRRTKHKHDSPEAIALMLSDNKLAELSNWNYGKLQPLQHNLEIAGFDTTLTGFENTELEEIDTKLANLEKIVEDDFDPEAEVEPVCQPGDIWILGRHRLLCGDATKNEDMQQLMNNQLADLIITDPPYNVDYTGATKDQLKIKNDKMDNEKFHEFLLKSYQAMYNAAAPGASIYVFHADTEAVNFRETFTMAGWKLAQCCIWAKQSLVMGRQDYHWQHEPVLYGWKPTGPHHWYSDRKQSTLWHFQKPTKNLEHPTMKPIELISYPLQNSSKKGDLILDPFGGSGSTLMAAEQTERTCHTMELDLHYCDVIINRWEEFTGEKAELVKH